jgi:hypothetical protein
MIGNVISHDLNLENLKDKRKKTFDKFYEVCTSLAVVYMVTRRIGESHVAGDI